MLLTPSEFCSSQSPRIDSVSDGGLTSDEVPDDDLVVAIRVLINATFHIDGCPSQLCVHCSFFLPFTFFLLPFPFVPVFMPPSSLLHAHARRADVLDRVFGGEHNLLVIMSPDVSVRDSCVTCD